MSSNNPEGRPRRYENLGEFVVMRVPNRLTTQLKEMFSELDTCEKMGEDATEVLSKWVSHLNKINGERDEV